MSCWNKEQLEQMLDDVIDALDLSESAIAEHGPLGTPPAELVRLVLARKDATICMLRAGMVDVRSGMPDSCKRVKNSGYFSGQYYQPDAGRKHRPAETG